MQVTKNIHLIKMKKFCILSSFPCGLLKKHKTQTSPLLHHSNGKKEGHSVRTEPVHSDSSTASRQIICENVIRKAAGCVNILMVVITLYLQLPLLKQCFCNDAVYRVYCMIRYTGIPESITCLCIYYTVYIFCQVLYRLKALHCVNNVTVKLS